MTCLPPGHNGIVDLFSDIEVVIAALGAIVFAVSYAVFFNWRKTAAGRALMYFVVSLILLTVINSLGRWLGPDYWGRIPIRFVVYSAVVFTVWRLVQVLWRNWRNGSSNPLDLQSKDRYRDG